MSTNTNISRECWVCKKKNVSLSLLPISWASSHHDIDIQQIQNTQTVKGKIYYNHNDGSIRSDFTKDDCAYLCFNCAH